MYKVKFSMDGEYKAYGSFDCKNFVWGENQGQMTFWALEKTSTKNIQKQIIESTKIVAYDLKTAPEINGADVALDVFDIAYYDYPLDSSEVPNSVHYLLRGLE